MDAPHLLAFDKAKVELMSKADSAFFTTIVFSLKHVWDDSIPTAQTNGREIRFSPKFFMSLDKHEQVFLIVHEAMHVAYLHMTRLMGRDRRKFNRAADYVINLQLVDRGFKMPKVGLLDRQYAGMSTEQVYDLLPDDPTADVMLDIMPGDGPEDDLTQEIQDILVRANIQSKMAGDKPGTIPGDIEIFLNGLLDPKLPWNRILQKYLQTFAKNDYSFRKPNRRFFPQHHMPSLHGEKLMDLAIAVDTSGSVSDADFHAFVTEVSSILRMMKPEKITLVQFDTGIKSVDELKNVADLMRCKFTGRGGTAIGPVMQWANEKKPQLLLVFSDGEFRFYDDNRTKSETLWIIHNDPNWKAPFGKTIHYSI